MVRFGNASGWSLDIQQDVIDSTCGIDTLDPKWRGTDGNGHEHHYDRERYEYPTLDYIVDAEHWCNGDEGLGLHDPHMAVDESHYECKVCREVIKPGVIPAGTPSSIPGARRATLVAPSPERSAVVTLAATEDEVERIMAFTDDASRLGTAMRIIDDAPDERIISVEPY